MNPDVSGFITDCKSVLGGILPLVNPTLGVPALLLFDALNRSDWTDAQALLNAVSQTLLLTPDQWAAVKAAAVARNIPVELA